MANSNVRFYKLATLPSFEAKHKGIFVHVTSKLTRTIKEGTYNYIWDKLDSNTIQNIVIQKIGERTVLVPEWMELRRLDTVESGLWFGGENGWELLSNDTNEINAKIQELDVPGYAQAEITTTTDSSTLTIKGIKEVDGKIGIPVDTENRDLNIKIDGVYTESNKIATQSTVTTAIEALDVNTAVQAVTFNTNTLEVNGNTNTTLKFNGVKEENGKIKQGDGADTFIVGDAKLKIQIGSATIDNVFSANAQSDGAINLNENVFTKDVNNVISVITLNNDVSSTNPLVTKADINGLASAMHYRGGVTSLPQPNENTKQGDVWIVTTGFGEYEVGDMFIARADGASATFDTVQGNLTLGIGDGQIAKNVGTLVNGNLVVATATETGTGIKTIGITEDDLTGTTNGNNTRTLSIANSGAVDNGFYHAVTVSDTFKVIGKDFNQSINISSANRSIEIAKNGETGVMVDLVWNTTMDSDTNTQL